MVQSYQGLSPIPFQNIVLDFGFLHDETGLYSVDLTGLPPTVIQLKIYAGFIGYSHTANPHRVIQLLHLEELKKLKNLNALVFENCTNINMDILLSLPNLKYLYLINCSTVEPEKLNQLKARGVSVTYLDNASS